MSGLELNKIAAAILLSSLIAMIVAVVANILYKPVLVVAQRGYQIEAVADNASADSPAADKQVDIAKLMANANAEDGAKVIKKCVSCHSFEAGGANKIGPNLWKVVGAVKGHKTDFAYSKAMISFGGVWDQESLYHFLNRPGKYIPGTKMSFAGISKPEDIANVIAYLKEKAG